MATVTTKAYRVFTSDRTGVRTLGDYPTWQAASEALDRIVVTSRLDTSWLEAVELYADAAEVQA